MDMMLDSQAKELADEHGWFLPQQFESEANAWVHRETTGAEILDAFAGAGQQLDYLVASSLPGGDCRTAAFLFFLFDGHGMAHLLASPCLASCFVFLSKGFGVLDLERVP